MEIRHDPQNDPSRRPSDITRPIRKGVKGTVERAAEIRSEERREVHAQRRSEALRRLVRPIESPDAEAASGTRKDTDRVEVSAAGSLLASEGGAHGSEENGARAERVAALKAAHDRGELHTPERVELAARRLLGERPDPAQIV